MQIAPFLRSFSSFEVSRTVLRASRLVTPKSEITFLDPAGPGNDETLSEPNTPSLVGGCGAGTKWSFVLAGRGAGASRKSMEKKQLQQ